MMRAVSGLHKELIDMAPGLPHLADEGHLSLDKNVLVSRIGDDQEPCGSVGHNRRNHLGRVGIVSRRVRGSVVIATPGQRTGARYGATNIFAHRKQARGDSGAARLPNDMEAGKAVTALDRFQGGVDDVELQHGFANAMVSRGAVNSRSRQVDRGVPAFFEIVWARIISKFVSTSVSEGRGAKL
jgi:hypothetical protein